MKKLIIILTILIICITIFVGCGGQTRTTEAVASPTSTQIQYVDRIIEKEVPVEVEKIVEVEKEVVKTEYVEVEKPVYIEKEVVKTEYVEVPVEVEVEKEVIVEKEIIKTVEVEKYIEREYSFATIPELLTVGQHWDYLVVYNASTQKGMGYNSYVLPAACKAYSRYGGDYGFFGGQGFPEPCINLSCYDYQEGEDLSKYIVDCTNRTAPGRYNGAGGWQNCYQTGYYILENATVQYVHASTLCTYGGTPVKQVIIQYDHAYHAVEI